MHYGACIKEVKVVLCQRWQLMKKWFRTNERFKSSKHQVVIQLNIIKEPEIMAVKRFRHCYRWFHTKDLGLD